MNAELKARAVAYLEQTEDIQTWDIDNGYDEIVALAAHKLKVEDAMKEMEKRRAHVVSHTPVMNPWDDGWLKGWQEYADCLKACLSQLTQEEK